MDNLGDILGGLFGGGGDAGDGATDLVAGLFGSRGGEGDADTPPIVYERYLCGGPKVSNVNDR